MMRANQTARLDASPIALLAAALVFGVALGFGSAFFDEMRHPRVSDEHEVERVTGARVLSTIRPRPRQPDRRRRAADRDAPPYFDPGADGYQLTYLHVARTGASRLMLRSRARYRRGGCDRDQRAAMPPTSAKYDHRRHGFANVAGRRGTRIHAEPGLADVMDRRIDWAEATSQATVGRDRVVDVLPSGITPAARIPAKSQNYFSVKAHESRVITKRSSSSHLSGKPRDCPAFAIPDAIVCARQSCTRCRPSTSAGHDSFGRRQSLGNRAVGRRAARASNARASRDGAAPSPHGGNEGDYHGALIHTSTRSRVRLASHACGPIRFFAPSSSICRLLFWSGLSILGGTAALATVVVR